MPSDLEYDNDWGIQRRSNVEVRDRLPVVNPSARPKLLAINQQLLKVSRHSRLSYGDTIKATGSESQQGDRQSKKDDAQCAEK